ncbi:unnamed protein product, partial [Rotaria sp. Silwood2]
EISISLLLLCNNIDSKKLVIVIMSTSFDTIIVANRRYEELFNAGKLDELVNLYTSEGKVLLSNKNKYEGREKFF